MYGQPSAKLVGQPYRSPRGQTVVVREARASFTDSERPEAGPDTREAGRKISAGVRSEAHLGLAGMSGLHGREAENNAEEIVWV